MSRLFILDIKVLDRTYQHVMNFPTKEAQSSFFTNRIKESFEDKSFSWVRNDRVAIEKPFEDAKSYTYMMYNNAGRLYYAFITDVIYINEEVTELLFKADVFQTYMFEHTLEECFVEREHQDRFIKTGSTVTRKYNLVKENLEIGEDYETLSEEELVYQTSVQVKYLLPLLIVTTKTTGFPDMFGLQTPFASFLSFVDIRYSVAAQPVRLTHKGVTRDLMTYSDILNNFADDPETVAIFPLTYPISDITVTLDSNGRYLITSLGSNLANNNFSQFNETSRYFISLSLTKSLDLLAPVRVYRKTIATLTPSPQINNTKQKAHNIINESKLYTDPFYFHMVYTHYANIFKIKNELLEGTNLDFEYFANIGPDVKELLQIKGSRQEWLKIITQQTNDLPLITDAWKNYLATNRASRVAGIAIPVIQTIAGVGIAAATGGAGAGFLAGSALSTAGQIANNLVRKSDIKTTPDNIRSAGNNVAFDVLIGQFFYKFITRSIQSSFKERIYKYFMRYGYQANEFKKPNLNSRYYYNYIKVIDAHIKGDLDVTIKEELKRIYESGVTIWHNRNNFNFLFTYDYENYEMIFES